MKNLLVIAILFISLSSTAYADVGCGPSPQPYIEKVPDTGEDTGGDTGGDTGEEAQDSGEEAKWSPKPIRFAVLFAPVLGLAFFARRRE